MGFAKFTVQTTGVRIISVVGSIAGGVINARWLGVDRVGVLVLLALIPNFTFHYGNLGFGSAIAYFLAKGEMTTRTAMKIGWILGGFMSVFSTVILLFIWKKDFSPLNDIQIRYILFYLPTIPLLFFINFMQRIFSGMLRITESNLAIIIGSVSSIVCISLFVIVLDLGIEGAIFAVLISQFMIFGFLFIRLHSGGKQIKNNSEASTAKLRPVLWECWHYGKWNYLLMFANFFNHQLPLILLKKIVPDNSLVGVYSKAVGLGEQSQIISDPIAKLLFPFTAASQKDEATQRTNLLCRNSLFIMVFVVGMMVLLAVPLIRFLYGEEFIPAAPIFYLIAPSVIFWPCSDFLAIHVAASGQPKAVFFVGLMTLLMASGAGWFLIGSNDMVGAGITMSLATISSTILRLLLYVKVTGTKISKVMVMQKEDWYYYITKLKEMRRKYHHIFNKD